jgi:maltokinase
VSPVLELDTGQRLSMLRVIRAWLIERTNREDPTPTPDPDPNPDRAPAFVTAPAADPVPDPVVDPAPPAIAIREVEILRTGRPGLLDVLADVDGRIAHVVLGLRRPGAEQHPLRAGEEAVLGLLEDETGMAVVVDALRDFEMAPLVLASVLGNDDPLKSTVTPDGDDDGQAGLVFDSWTLTVFPWPADRPHPGVDLLMALDGAGFNHLAAPLARWQRGGRDLGVVQELLAGTAQGWALALTSLRDLYGAGGRPEDAGGDFGPESKALGTMTARLHLALDRAFGRRSSPVSDWVDWVEKSVNETDPTLLTGQGLLATMASLRSVDLRGTTLRTHGDLHLGRTARTDQGWVLADCSPGGRPPGATEPVFRSPLCDVADMLWSFHHVASVAVAERDPTGATGLVKLAQAWESYNRRAFLAGYLATPGIGGLVPTDREVVRNLAAMFEFQREANRIGAVTTSS